ncbi:5-oxoprolinase subunit PxpB [Hymenobacter sp. BT491]|uniref:5-oxoprolinase subunit PxpB n=1 Tax=Hymenobacter sp. BT491 TaxID=2766779 RepID=UPI001653CE73|nr:5-oxoprolinase subunit PxpB [Hymenobacter sp. BT491]MBC6990138.1 5-oxoprolinase subunit PxpB [Hymenobacter sp. BT491]
MENPQRNPSRAPAAHLAPVGDSGLVVQFGDAIELPTHLRVQAFSACLREHPFPGLIEYVPAFASVTVYYDPWVLSQAGRYNPYEEVTRFIHDLLRQAELRKEKLRSKVVEIPVWYGGKFGPDLEFVADYAQLSVKQVISLHTHGEYLVYMIGFAPGFPYIGGLNEKIAVPRKDKPRTKVPAGSVGIGGLQTGVYPIQTPGGWQLIGRTPLQLFNPQAASPSLLQAGDRVRFVAITEKEFERRREYEF